jgi:5-methylcytosine-specific restriction endonuclease McrA
VAGLLTRKKVLVLNKSWQAIKVVPLKDALNKVFTCYEDGEPKAKIIDCANDFQGMTWSDWSEILPEHDEEHIKSINAIFRIPEVIQLTKYDKVPKPRVHFSRRTLYKRDNYTCQYCNKKFASELLNIDHVQPRSRGGLSTWENCVLACIKCNTKKADRTPEEAGMKLAKVPVRPKYNLVLGEYRAESWKNFVSEAYWSCELENDNK